MHGKLSKLLDDGVYRFYCCRLILSAASIFLLPLSFAPVSLCAAGEHLLLYFVYCGKCWVSLISCAGDIKVSFSPVKSRKVATCTYI